jgi:endoglucanase
MRWFFLLTIVPVLVIVESLAVAEPAAQINDPAVHLNTVGYLPDSRKLGTAATKIEDFVVRDLKTGKQVMQGTASQVEANPAGQPLYQLDFSAVNREGTYRIEFGERGFSEFRVAKDVYNWPFYCVMRAMYLSRCGTKVSAVIDGKRFEHGACHTEDAYLDFIGGPIGKRKDGTGGWHDAGDYNKYTVNAAFTAGMLLTAWEHFHERLATLKLDVPESGNRIPDFLNEVRWELDWLLKMQADDGSVYHLISTRDFGGYGLPDKEKERRYFSPWSSAATANFVAIMAQSSRVYQEFDKDFSDRCLIVAKKSYTFLQSHDQNHHPDLSAFHTGQYDTRDSDDRLWAAAELWETTGDASVLRDCEKRKNSATLDSGASSLTVDADWDWSNLRNLGVFTYLRSRRPGRDAAIVARVRNDALRVADGIADAAVHHPYGRPFGNKYYWGCNGTVARQTMNLNIAYELTNDRRYRDASLDALNHLFGRNSYGRSYVTGLGRRPPLFPHDRRSAGGKVDNPWPGYLVGGPWPKPTDWLDDKDNYKTNEIAINWNGALVYALAAFVDPLSFDASTKDARNLAKGESATER